MGLIGAALSRSTWRWYNITLLVLILLITPFCFLLTARLVSTQFNWHNAVQGADRKKVEVELATSGSVPDSITADWKKLLTDLKVGEVMVRAAQDGERPSVDRQGTEFAPVYRVKGILAANGQLSLPKGELSVYDRLGVKTWLQTLNDKAVLGYENAIADTEQSIKDLKKGIVNGNAVIVPGAVQLDRDWTRVTWPHDRGWVNVPREPRPVSGGMLSAGIKDTIDPKSTYYIFESKSGSQGGTFLGEFKIEKLDNGAVIFDSLWPKTPEAIAKINASGPWDIYEIMPYDEHWTFAGMDAKQLADYFPAKLGAGENTRLSEVAKEYTRDGKPVPDSAPDAPDVWIKVQFEKDYSITDEKKTAPNDPNAGKYSFVKGDVGVFDPQSAAELIATHAAKKVGRQYVRTLRDYANSYRDYWRRQHLFEAPIALLRDSNQKVALGIQSVTAETAVRKSERDKLAADLAKFKEEAAIATKVTNKIEDALAKAKQDGSVLNQQVKALTAELESVQRSLLPGEQREATKDAIPPVKVAPDDKQALTP